MDRDTVVKLSIEAGVDKDTIDNQECSCEECNFMLPLMLRFATLVRNAALEEAATKCEKSDRYRGDYFASVVRELKDAPTEAHQDQRNS